ncbi:C-C motif chemokine 18-like [Stegastes partitus]|uniref:C-C motif chemokine 18-like n=1 Tax=Stegastes partitus TaxID=144197 RepID=A0A9Y4TWQ5_9TELE|nr:PREDICTED: C-C motif chemokine 18-like [Stegastes partitus]
MSAKMLSVAVLLVSVCVCFVSFAGAIPSGRHPGGKSRMCCVEVSRANVSSSVTDNKYHEQPAKDPCVHAIILTTTNRRKVCADPTAKWVQTLIANMTKV